MLHVFGDLREFITGAGAKHKPDVEGFVARLHYRVTAVMLLVCCILVTAIEYIGLGTHISCVQEGHPDNWPIPADIMNTYCFITSTFTLPRHLDSLVGVGEVVHPGVGAEKPGEERTYKAYYQWVPFVLFLQCCMFYIPHLLFKKWEHGKIIGIISDLHESSSVIQEEGEREPKYQALARYFTRTINTHNTWALKLYLSDLLLLINVVGNIYFIDTFLDGEFSTYGAQVARFVNEDPSLRTDPMTRVFPRLTKCIYKKFGASGSIQTHDALCLLPINVINEKIYVFLWFWLVLLAICTALSFIFHTAQAAVPSIIAAFIKRKARKGYGARRAVDHITSEFRFGDWKLLYILAFNMPPLVLGEFLVELENQAVSRREGLEAKQEDDASNVGNTNKPLLTPI